MLDNTKLFLQNYLIELLSPGIIFFDKVSIQSRNKKRIRKKKAFLKQVI